MHIFYNGNIIDSTYLSLEHDNRSFLYGDGLFETMIYYNDHIKFDALHNERLSAGMKALHFELPDNLSIDTIFTKIKELVRQSDLDSARIRLQVWRRSGGLYTPDTSKVDVVATCDNYQQNNDLVKKRISISNQVHLSLTPWSAYKTSSAIAYIQAGIEKKERNLDDLILLDQNGKISECTSSNIFWKIGNSYYTPSLNTGCIDGVMRKYIIDRLKTNKINIHVGEYSLNELEKATQVFTSNVTGVVPILSINNHQYAEEISIRPLLAL